MFNISKVLVDGELTHVPPEIQADRDRFHPITALVLAYCAQHELAVNNPNLIVYNDVPMDHLQRTTFVVDVYSDNPLKHGNDITNEIYEQCTKYVFLKTVIPSRDLEINVLGRLCVKLHRYPSIKQQNVSSSMTHITRVLKQFNDTRVTIIDPAVQLLETYHRLYKPFPETWKSVRQIEKILFESYRWQVPGVDDPTSSPYFAVQAGRSRSQSRARTSTRTSTPAHDTNTAVQIRTELYSRISTCYPEVVLLGSWAMKSLADPQLVHTTHDRLQMMVLPFEPDAWLEKFRNIVSEYPLSVNTLDVPVLDDYWLKRCTVSATINGERVAIAELYNSLAYEMVPYVETTSGHRVGNPWVLARFLLVDRLVTSFLVATHTLTSAVLERRSTDVFNNIKRLRELHTLRGGDAHEGIYRDQRMMLKLLVQSQDKKIYPYEPDTHMQRDGHLREITDHRTSRAIDPALGSTP